MASAEEAGLEESETTMEALAEGDEYTTRPMTTALAEENSDNGGGVSGGRGVNNASKVLETIMEVAAAQQQAQGIYEDDGVCGGRTARGF